MRLLSYLSDLSEIKDINSETIPFELNSEMLTYFVPVAIFMTICFIAISVYLILKMNWRNN
jgi:hypothetical protein